VKNEAQLTGNEFSDLANSRTMPVNKAANDTPLTRTSDHINLPTISNP